MCHSYNKKKNKYLLIICPILNLQGCKTTLKDKKYIKNKDEPPVPVLNALSKGGYFQSAKGKGKPAEFILLK